MKIEITGLLFATIRLLERIEKRLQTPKQTNTFDSLNLRIIRKKAVDKKLIIQLKQIENRELLKPLSTINTNQSIQNPNDRKS